MTDRASKLARFMVVAGFLVWIANAVLHCSPAPLGHDEAHYATDTAQLVEGSGKRYLYVSVGMNVVALPGIIAGGDERSLRVTPLIAGICFLLAAWWLARRVAHRDTACWVVAVLAGALPIVRFSADLLSDLPSAAALLGALAILLPELDREDGPRYRLVGAAPLLAAGFYIRYGNVLTVAIIGIVALIVGGRRITRRPGPVIATVALFVILLVPHAIYSARMTGSIAGILTTSAAVPGRTGEGLAGYFGANPFLMYGYLVAPLMLIGIAPLRRTRMMIAVQVIGLCQIVGLGITTHAQPRYVVVGVVLLAIVGADTLRRVIMSLGPRARLAGAATATIAVALLWVHTLRHSAGASEARSTSSAPTMLAAAAVKHDADGARCEIVGRETTQLDWYSGCRAHIQIFGESITAGARVYEVHDVRDRSMRASDVPVTRCLIFALPGMVEVFRIQSLDSACAFAR